MNNWIWATISVYDPEDANSIHNYTSNFLAQRITGNWVVAFPGNPVLLNWMSEIPSSLLTKHDKNLLTNSINLKSIATSTRYYRLPYPEGLSYSVTSDWDDCRMWDNQGNCTSYHRAIDFGMDEGDSVVAAMTGKVVDMKHNSTVCCGDSSCANSANFIKLYHANVGEYTLYYHFKPNSIPSNIALQDTIQRGEKIGEAGHTGWTWPACSGDHLHFAVKDLNNSAKNPDFIEKGGTVWTGDKIVSQNSSPDSTPPTITSLTPNCPAPNNQWQNTCYDPNFSWSATDAGSGVKDYNYAWGTESNASNVTWEGWSNTTSFDPPAITTVDGTAKYYLHVKARDNENNVSSVSTYGLLYDGSVPTVSFVINDGASSTNQTTVHLNLTANDTGSRVAEVCASNGGSSCDNWQPYTVNLGWTLPALNYQVHTVYAQVRDVAGNESAIASDDIMLDLYPVMPHSANYRVCQDVVNVGGSIDLASSSYGLVSAIGQPWGLPSSGSGSVQFERHSGFLSGLSGCLPITFTVSSNYTLTHAVIASAGNLRGSTTYRLGDTVGQAAASGATVLSSTNYLLSSGFWAQLTQTIPSTLGVSTPTPTITPTVTPTPGSTATPQPNGFGITINDGDLYTNDTTVVVRVMAPNVTQMRLSNDGGYVDDGWRSYQVTSTWVISTYQNYILPRIVYGWFKNAEGDVYGPYFDDIIYDATPPAGCVEIVSSGSNTMTLSIAAWDDISGVTDMRLNDTPDMTLAVWQPYTYTLTWPQNSGAVYAQFRDTADNLSAVYGTDGSNSSLTERVYLPLVLK